MKYENCLRCGRKLRTETSKLIGYGEVCLKREQTSGKYKELFSIEGGIKCEEQPKH